MNDAILDLFCMWQKKNSSENTRHLEMEVYGQFKLMQTQKDFEAFCACIEMLKPIIDKALDGAMIMNMEAILAVDSIRKIFDVEFTDIRGRVKMPPLSPAGSP